MVESCGTGSKGTTVAIVQKRIWSRNSACNYLRSPKNASELCALAVHADSSAAAFSPLHRFIPIMLFRTFIRRVAAIASAIALSALSPLGAQTISLPALPVAAKVSGVVYDSVRMEPMAKVQVWIPGTTISAVTDKSGQFSLLNVPAGRQTVAYSAAAFDSIGIGDRALEITVDASKNQTIRLNAPSGATLWKALCTNKTRIGSDSGIAWGAITDAHSGKLLSGAPVSFGWYDMKVDDKKALQFAEVRTEVLTDSTGQYVACGVPTDLSIAIQALGDSAASGEVQFKVSERMLYRVDLTVSRDLFSQAGTLLGAVKGSTAPLPRGRSTLRGTVHDEGGKPVPNVMIAISTVDTVVRTDNNGEFRISSLPSGTLGINARSIGYSSHSKLVDLRPDAALDVDIVLAKATALATYNVRAERAMSMDEQDFVERRKFNIGGHVINMKDRGFVDAIGPLMNIPRVRVSYGRNGPSITMQRPGAGNNCMPLIYFNGGRISADQLTTLNVDHLTVAEVYTNWMQVPPRYLGSMSDNPCGVILYWSRFTIKK